MEVAGDVGHYATLIGMLSVTQIGNFEQLLSKDEGGSSTIIGVQRGRKTDRNTKMFLGNLEGKTRVAMTVSLHYGTSEPKQRLKLSAKYYLIQLVVVDQVRSMTVN